LQFCNNGSAVAVLQSTGATVLQPGSDACAGDLTEEPSVNRTRTVPKLVAAAVSCALALNACSSDKESTITTITTSPPATVAPATTVAAPTIPPATTAPATTQPPATTVAATDPPTTTSSTSDELVAQIESVLADAIAPGSIHWNASGTEVPPTAAVAAVRIPGHDDVVVGVGENVDGSPVAADAPFGVASLAWSLVYTVAFQLIDEGVLDPTLTVDHWVPTLPNADRVTVQMMLDGQSGWSDYTTIVPDPITTDFTRAWSQREVVELQAAAMTAIAEPGTPTNDNLTNETVLGLVVEEVGGQPLTELVRHRVSELAGLDDTGLLDGTVSPVGYRDGVFAFEGTRVSGSDFDPVSWLTWNLASEASVSTPTDLLDLLDAWSTGELFTTDRTPAPDRYVPDPAGNPNQYNGVGVPFNAYCPCTEVEGGVEPTTIGRRPGTIGTRTFLLRYGDGISVVVNFNSDEAADDADLEAVVAAVHDLAVEAAG